MVEIFKVTPTFVEIVEIIETDDDDYIQYIRFGHNNWLVRIGESLEPVYRCDELEEKYNQKKNSPMINEIDKSDALRYRWLKIHNNQRFKLSDDEIYLHVCDRHSSEAVQDVVFDDIDATMDRLIKGK